MESSEPTTDELNKARDFKDYVSNNVEKFTNLFFTGGIDFVKWTTTLAIAAILWIVSTFSKTFNSQSSHNVLLILALIFFVVSIIFAIHVVCFSLLYWKNQIKKYNKMLDVLTAPELSTMLNTRVDFNEVNSNIDEIGGCLKKETSHLGFFISFIVLHIAFLVIALLLLTGYVWTI